jgi:hypothetical protein
MQHQLVQNCDQIANHDPYLVKLARELTLGVLDVYPELVPHADFIMTAPVKNVRRSVIEACTRPLACRFSIDYDLLGPRRNRPEYDYDILRNMVYELGAELKRDYNLMLGVGFQVCPYVMIIPQYTIDPSSFERQLSFVTRRGTYTYSGTREAISAARYMKSQENYDFGRF